MKIIVAVLLASLSAGAALADSYSVGIGGGSGAGKTSPISFDGFDASLGTLNSATFDVSATTTYDVTLYTPAGDLPPSGTATYDFKNGLFLYINGLSTQPYVQESGSGTASLSYGVFSASTAGLDGITVITGGLLSAFLMPTLTGQVSVDDPFVRTISANGLPAGASTFDITAKSINASVTYDYTPYRSAVPEPASWALMLAGFGAAGMALRRRPRAVALG